MADDHLLAGAGKSDVQKPALFIEMQPIVDAADKDAAELQTFGCVYRRQCHHGDLVRSTRRRCAAAFEVGRRTEQPVE